MEKLNYTDAFAELQDIVQEMEQGQIGIDDLALKVKRAAVLIQFCKEKLKNTELDVQQILAELESSGDKTE